MSNPVRQAVQNYAPIINDTPVLLSLLYDVDLLPEQIISMREAVCMAAVVEAYLAGKNNK